MLSWNFCDMNSNKIDLPQAIKVEEMGWVRPGRPTGESGLLELLYFTQGSIHYMQYLHFFFLWLYKLIICGILIKITFDSPKTPR